MLPQIRDQSLTNLLVDTEPWMAYVVNICFASQWPFIIPGKLILAVQRPRTVSKEREGAQVVEANIHVFIQMFDNRCFSNI